MFVGFDYGSANCAMGVMDKNEVRLLPLAVGSHYLTSTLYALDKELIVEAVYQQMPAALRADYAKVRSAQLARARHARRELDLGSDEQTVLLVNRPFTLIWTCQKKDFMSVHLNHF